MNKLKDKWDSYVFSPVEESQRQTLLDNLSTSAEQVEEEANTNIKENNAKEISDKESVVVFCDCLIAVLSHELKIIHVREKPSFWLVAERITPRDTIQMIYRLGIRQSDSARCHVWVRHALIEGTMGSYLTLLEEDTKMIKQFYKSTAFVRDPNKMESAKILINSIIATIHFKIKLDVSTNFNQNRDLKQNGPISLIQRSNKERKSPNIVTPIEGSSSSPQIDSLLHSNNYHSLDDNYHSSSPEFVILNQSSLPIQDKRTLINSPSLEDDLSQCSGSPMLNSTENKEIPNTLNPNDGTFNSGQTDLSYSSGTSSIDSLMAGCITQDDDVIVNMIRVASVDGEVKSAEDTLRIYVKDNDNSSSSRRGSLITDSMTNNPNDRTEDIVVDDHQPHNEASENTKTGCNNTRTQRDNGSDNSKTEFSSLRNPCIDESTSSNSALCTTNNSTSDKTILYEVGETDSPNINLPSNNDTSVHPVDIKSEIEATLTSICCRIESEENCTNFENNRNDSGSLKSFSEISNTSEKIQKNMMIESSEKRMNQISYDQFTNENDRVPDNPPTKFSIDDLSSSGSIKMEEEYRNQNNNFQPIIPLEGSSQLSNVLDNVMVSTAEDYYVPGIHYSRDVHVGEVSTRYSIDMQVGELQDTSSVSIPPSEKSKSSVRNSSSTPTSSPLSSLSSRLLEKTLFRRKGSFGSTNSFDKGSNDVRGSSDTDSDSACQNNLFVDLGVSDSFIGLKEDHFSPDSFMGFSSLEELDNAITSCKQLIKAAPEKSKRRDELVTQLVQLRLKRHEIQDYDQLLSPKEGKKVLGHQFFKQASITSTLECDSCGATIFPLLQKVYVCKDCGFHCHGKCLELLEKPCVHNKKLNATYELKICPEISLAAQQYRCADCFKRIPMYDGQFEARLCDYTGQKYCAKCHWNDTSVIPARVVHNWDFSTYQVSRQSKHLLLLLSKKPDIKLQSVNGVLFNFVDELRDVRTLRQQIIMMKQYIVSCRIATEERLLLLLQSRQHFVDNSDVYSLQDLIDTNNNVLLNELSRVHAKFGKHIKFDCQLCQGKGFICEFCNEGEIIFPFDNHVVVCKCKGTFHRLCYSQTNCPKCLRNSKKGLNT